MEGNPNNGRNQSQTNGTMEGNRRALSVYDCFQNPGNGRNQNLTNETMVANPWALLALDCLQNHSNGRNNILPNQYTSESLQQNHVGGNGLVNNLGGVSMCSNYCLPPNSVGVQDYGAFVLPNQDTSKTSQRNHVGSSSFVDNLGGICMWSDYSLPSNSVGVLDYGASSVLQNRLGELWGCNVGQNPSVETPTRTATSSEQSTETIEEEDIIKLLYRNREISDDSQILMSQAYLNLLSDDPRLLIELQGDQICIMARNRIGCKYLQRILAIGDHSHKTKIFEGTLGSIVELMTDKNGNVIVQKLLESCNCYQLGHVICIVTAEEGVLTKVANDKYGMRSIQKLIMTIKRVPQLVTLLMPALVPEVFALMTNQYGRYVIKHCLSQLDDRQIMFIFKAAVERCLDLATDEHGCLLLNDCIDCSKFEYRDALLNVITDHSVFLAQDPFGNYAMQKVLSLQHPTFIKKICSRLQGVYAQLSMQKCGSHIVEKCIKSPEIQLVIDDLVKSNKLEQVARDQYGNYVIQTALKRAKGVLLSKLIAAIRPFCQRLQSHPYGRTILALINRI
ncbi:pumilio homolog 12-like [Tasmannia lanceolata]|uniref:pumilio homolog 12-like n=1 Tax=Tasmannia lanceolata TaxID=3420 RepID=UPI0040644272